MNDTVSALIVIPTLDEEEHIGALLDKLIKNTDEIERQIVVADGGSTDKTQSIVKGFAEQHDFITLIHNEMRIQSAAINLAVKQYGADHSYLIRLDAHSDFPDNFCQIVIDEAEKMECASVVTPMDTIGHEPFQRAVAAAQNSKLGNGGSLHRNADSNGQYVDHGHHALMRIDAFEEIGGYDENFSHNEDAELDKRLIDAGYKIWLCPAATSTYFPRKTAISLFKQYMNYGHGRCQTLLKHKMKPKIRQMIPVAILPLLIFSIFGLNIAMFGFASWLLLCLGYGVFLGAKTKDTDIVLFSGIAAAIIHFAWSCGFWQKLFEHITGYRR